MILRGSLKFLATKARKTKDYYHDLPCLGTPSAESSAGLSAFLAVTACQRTDYVRVKFLTMKGLLVVLEKLTFTVL